MKILLSASNKKQDSEYIGKETRKWTQIMQRFECFLESIVQKYQSTNGEPGTFDRVLLFCLLPSYLPLMVLTWRMMNTDPLYLSLYLKIVLNVSFLCCMIALPRDRKNYMYKRHYYDIQRIPSFLGGLLIILYAVMVLLAECATYDILNIFFNISTFISTVFYAFLQAQQSTKLRFDPMRHTANYTKSHSNTHKGTIRILESSAFHITILNSGIEPWNAADFKIRRIGLNHEEIYHFCEFNLPAFTLQPLEQIELIPETLYFEGECVRIPGFHCFADNDVSEVVKTQIFNSKNRHWLHILKEGYPSTEKIAELVTFYEESEGTQKL